MEEDKPVTVQYVSSEEEKRVANPHFLLSEKGSSIFLGASTNNSAWNGIGFLDLSSYTLTKAIHAITASSAVHTLQVSPKRVTRVREECSETFFMHDRLACYHIDGSTEVVVDVDVRAIDDFSTHGREHSARITGDNPFVLTFGNASGSFVLVSSAPISLLDEWVCSSTAYDSVRSGRDEWWVQRRAALQVSSSARVIIAPSNRLSEAIHVLRAGHVWSKQAGSCEDVALAHASKSLQGVVTETPSGEASILAGLPWFYQIYTRDEAIATGALIQQGSCQLAGRVLLREVATILPSGLIPNRFPHSGVGSADGVGWAFLRLRELFLASRESLHLDQWSFVFRQLRTSLARLEASRFKDGLVFNEVQETWMDTLGGTGDARSGARIEIQALTVNMYRFAGELAEFFEEDSSLFRKKESSLAGLVREEFFAEEQGLLADGLGDWTVRPNVFIAFYAYDVLLRRGEWEEVFARCLDELFVDWGSFATISSSHELFCSEHSGENDRSYHRGDAWFFLSNLAAVCLLRVSSSFSEYVEKIYLASRDDLLWRGACGHCSEISSASSQQAFGCWSQAWSASSFIELSLALRRSE